MALDLTNCKECGAVTLASENRGWCKVCALRRIEQLEAVYHALDRLDEEDLTLEKLAEASGLGAEVVKQLVRKSHVLRRDVERAGPRTCNRCKKEEVQESSVFCVSCSLLLFERLRKAHDDLQCKADRKRRQRRGWLPRDEQSRATVVETLEKKRGKAPLGKLDPAPKSRFRS